MSIFDASVCDPTSKRPLFAEFSAALNISRIRIIVPRHTLTDPKYTETLVEQLKIAKNAGYAPYITFDDYYLTDSPDDYAADLVKFYTMLKNATAEVTEWSSLNEPDISIPWVVPRRNQIPADLAAKYYVAAKTQLGAVCPDCVLAAGELAYGGQSPYGKYLNSSFYLYHYQETLRKANVWPQVWSMHAYRDVVEDSTHHTAEFAETLTNLGWTDFRVWITETATLMKGTAASDTNAENQKAAARRLKDLSSRVPRVERVYYYEFRTAWDATHPWDSALVDREGRPRPAFCEFTGRAEADCNGSLEYLLPHWEKLPHWDVLGDKFLFGPTVSSWADGRLDVFGVGTDRALWHQWYTRATGWSTPESLGGILRSSPTAVSWGPDRIDVFARGDDDAVWHRAWDTFNWTPWESLGGVTDEAPSVASPAEGRLDVVARGTDGAIWHNSWGGAWSGWEPLGMPPTGRALSAPAAISTDAGWFHVFTRGADGTLWYKVWYGSGWIEWAQVNNVVGYGAPALSSWEPGRLDVFSRSEDNEMVHLVYEGGKLTGWPALPGTFPDTMAAASWGPGRIDLFVGQGDEGTWHASFDRMGADGNQCPGEGGWW